MRVKFPKSVRAKDIADAVQLCKDNAEAHTKGKPGALNVERIAGKMGILTNTLYNYLGNGKIPANLILSLENTCGFGFITQYLAHSHDCLLIPVPSGRKASKKDIIELQTFMLTVSQELLKLDEKTTNLAELSDDILKLMQDLAYQRHNTEKLMNGQREMFR